jgi:hypothetical protein
MLYSLAMRLEPLNKGVLVSAPWLKKPVWGETWEVAYKKALQLRARQHVRSRG